MTDRLRRLDRPIDDPPPLPPPPPSCGHEGSLLCRVEAEAVRAEATIARLREALEAHHRGVILPAGTCAICAALEET